MKVKILKPVTFRNAVNGELTSYRDGAIVTVADETGAAWISEGLAEAYTLVTPTGTKTITENGEGIDVAGYAEADVNVPSVQPTGKITITANGTNIDVAQYATADVAVPAAKVAVFMANWGEGGSCPATLNNKEQVIVHADANGQIQDPGDPVSDGNEFMYWTVEGSDEQIVFPYTLTADVAIFPRWEGF